MNYHSLTPVAPWRHKRKLKNVLKYEIICKFLYFELKKIEEVWEVVVFPIIHLLLFFFLVFDASNIKAFYWNVIKLVGIYCFCVNSRGRYLTWRRNIHSNNRGPPPLTFRFLFIYIIIIFFCVYLSILIFYLNNLCVHLSILIF